MWLQNNDYLFITFFTEDDNYDLLRRYAFESALQSALLNPGDSTGDESVLLDGGSTSKRNNRNSHRIFENKRGVGSCIYKCLNGRGQMNFIQCRSMCRWHSVKSVTVIV